MTQLYSLRVGASYSGKTRHVFIGRIVEEKINTNNDQPIYRLEFAGEPGASLWEHCWFNADDLVPSTAGEQ
jgi:hypothetical protein